LNDFIAALQLGGMVKPAKEIFLKSVFVFGILILVDGPFVTRIFSFPSFRQDDNYHGRRKIEF